MSTVIEQALAETNPLGRSEERPLPNIEIRIEPARGWQLFNARELWQYRELLYSLAWRDVKVRYKQTVLGAAWAILQPAMMMVVFTAIFSRMAHVAHADIPYPLFVFAGLLPWIFFSTAITAASNSVIGAERMITKIYFPRLIVPFASVGAAFVDLLVAMFGLLLLMMFYGVTPSPGLFAAPFILAVIVLAAMGVGTLLSALTVAYRDFRYVVPFLVQIWLFATPSVYMETGHGARLAAASGEAPADWAEYALQWLHYIPTLNPMTTLIAAFRAAVLGEAAAWGSLLAATVAALIVFVMACLYFRRIETSFADII